jgi:hypothetical protein
LLGVSDLGQKGFCLVTYHPEELHQKALDDTDFFFIPLGARGAERLADLLKVAGVDEVDPAWLLAMNRPGHALRVASRGREPELFRVGLRSSHHVRHWHKYMHIQLPERLRFFFRDGRGLLGQSAGNVSEFHQSLMQVPDGSIIHHASLSDFSRWGRDVFQDEELARSLGLAERELIKGPGAVRIALVQAIEARYQDESLLPVA